MTAYGVAQRCNAVLAAYKESKLEGVQAECRLLHDIIESAVTLDNDTEKDGLALLFSTLLSRLGSAPL